MLLKVYTDYYTAAHENLYLVAAGQSVYMHPVGHDTKTCSVELPEGSGKFLFTFEMRDNSGTVRREWAGHVVEWAEGVSRLDIFSFWRERPKHPELTSAFVENVILHRSAGKIAPLKPGEMSVSVVTETAGPDEEVVMAGNIPQLGEWDVTRALVMAFECASRFTAVFPLPAPETRIDYKFFVRKKGTQMPLRWENRFNREFTVPESDFAQCIALDGLEFSDTVTSVPRVAGTVIPVFSLRSSESFGIGDFEDLGKMADWLKATGQRMLQILPVNDTTSDGSWHDSYPYNAISSFALHPIYLRVQKLGRISDTALGRRLERTRKRLNALPSVDYEKVFKTKMEYARAAFTEHGAETLASVGYGRFVSENKSWLESYAAFCVLRDKFGTTDFHSWPEHSVFTSGTLREVEACNGPEMDFYRYLQYHLHLQLSAASEHAAQCGVGLKGDIPIGVSPFSADVWVNPSLFHLDCSAGAPPDDFAVNGQNWGFPTYNWEAMAVDGYAWWKARFRNMARYFHAYRIDHILGFFRIWQIPREQIYGVLGTFAPALPMAPEEMENLGFRFSETVPVLRKGDETQRDIRQRFRAMPDTSANRKALKESLDAVADVLFIADPANPALYHPRIAGEKTNAFSQLPEDQKEAYLRLSHHFFYERHNDFWGESAMRKLPPLIDATSMLVCGEDLGMIPACVAPVMRKLSILSLEVQRMPKQYGVEFADPASYPPLSVATTSTHDMPTLRQWIEDDPARTGRLLAAMGEPSCTNSAQICHMVVEQHLHSPSMLAMFPWQDWMSISPELRRDNPADELINNPADPGHRWCYRMHIDIENLLAENQFNSLIASLVAQSGR